MVTGNVGVHLAARVEQCPMTTIAGPRRQEVSVVMPSVQCDSIKQFVYPIYPIDPTDLVDLRDPIPALVGSEFWAPMGPVITLGRAPKAARIANLGMEDLRCKVPFPRMAWIRSWRSKGKVPCNVKRSSSFKVVGCQEVRLLLHAVRETLPGRSQVEGASR